MMATVSRSASEGVMGIAIGPHPLRVFEAGAASAAATMARDNAEQIGGLKVKLGNLEKENHELEEANNKLRQENAAWKKKVAELTSHIDELSSGLQVAVKERELSETTFTEQISALTNQAAFSEKKRIELEKENIRLKQNNADLLKKVAKLEFTVAQLEGDLEIEVDARREAETRLREQLSEAKNTAKEALSRVSDLEAGVEGLRVSEEELTRRDCAISLRTFGVETSKAVMHYIWPDYDEDIGSLKDMVDVLHTLKADGPLSGSQNWVSSARSAVLLALLRCIVVVLNTLLSRAADQGRVGRPVGS